MKGHHPTSVAAVILLLAFGAWTPARAQAPAALPIADAQVYDGFVAWIKTQPSIRDLPTALEGYRQVLAKQGLERPEIERRIEVIVQHGRQREVDRWNRILTSASPAFNTQPNAFLVQMTQGRAPGRALDVGMGQGRNAIYLAQQGWTVTGFDPADKAVAAANETAKRLGVRLTTVIAGDEEFEFGREQWDLIVLSYVSLRHLTARVYDSLKPGGLVVVEAFHQDATKESTIGGGVVFDSNELLRLFDRYRIVRYEDADAIGDFGLKKTRVVRLAAQKP
jgi:SAM-dependent methyltransferase